MGCKNTKIGRVSMSEGLYPFAFVPICPNCGPLIPWTGIVVGPHTREIPENGAMNAAFKEWYSEENVESLLPPHGELVLKALKVRK